MDTLVWDLDEIIFFLRKMNKLKMTEDVSPSSAYTIAWFPSRGTGNIRGNNPPEPSTQGWIIFFG